MKIIFLLHPSMLKCVYGFSFETRKCLSFSEHRYYKGLQSWAYMLILKVEDIVKWKCCADYLFKFCKHRFFGKYYILCNIFSIGSVEFFRQHLTILPCIFVFSLLSICVLNYPPSLIGLFFCWYVKMNFSQFKVNMKIWCVDY